MAFSEAEKVALLEVKGVGPTVVKRFEEIGIETHSQSWPIMNQKK